MKTQFGAIIVNGRGKIGAEVASENHYGTFLRVKVTPLDPTSSYKTLMRGYFTSVSQSWRNLSESKRLLWNSATANFSFLDCFATVRHLSGFNLFMSCNMMRVITSRSIITVPPVPIKIPSISIVSVVADFSAATMILTLSANLQANQTLLIYSSLPVSPGVSRFYGTFYYLFAIDVYGSLSRFIHQQWTARLGIFPSVGSKLFFKVVVMDRLSGLTSLPSIISTIVAP